MGPKGVLQLLGHEDRVGRGLCCQPLSSSRQASENSLCPTPPATDGEPEAQRGKISGQCHAAPELSFSDAGPGSVPVPFCL